MVQPFSLARLLAPLAFTLALLLGATPHSALATPPDSVSIDDTIIGANATHLFVLRETSDNLGSHFEYRGEVWLVAIDAADGSEESWPVYGISATTDFSEDRDIRVSTADDMAQKVNPYAILAEREANPYDILRNPHDREGNEARRSGSSVEFGDYVMPIEGALDQMRASVVALAARVADPPRMASVSTAEIYAMKTFEPGLCHFQAEGWPVSPADGSPAWQPVRVTCADSDVMDTTSLIQIAHLKSQSAEPE